MTRTSMHKLALVHALLGIGASLAAHDRAAPSPAERIERLGNRTPPQRDQAEISARQRKRQAKLARRAARAAMAATPSETPAPGPAPDFQKWSPLLCECRGYGPTCTYCRGYGVQP